MKTTILLVALAALFGLSMAMRLPAAKKSRNMNQLLKARSVLKRDGGDPQTAGQTPEEEEVTNGDGSEMVKDGKCDEASAKEYTSIQVMLAFNSLANKCKLHSIIGGGEFGTEGSDTTTLKRRRRSQDAVTSNTETLDAACPGVAEFFWFYKEAPEWLQWIMVGELADHALIFQCVNMFAEWEIDMQLGVYEDIQEQGINEMKFDDVTMVYVCIAVFGSADEEAKAVDDDLANAEAVATDDKRSKALRSILNQFQELLKKTKLTKK